MTNLGAMLRPLTSSELRAFQTCKRGWYINYYRDLRRKYDVPKLSTIGNLVHGVLELYYDGQDVDSAEYVSAEVGKMMEQYPDEGETIYAAGSLATIMLDGYFDWVEEEGVDAGFEYVGSEMMVEAPVGPYILRGKIDARLRRRIDDALLQLEHKTVQNLTDLPNFAQQNQQFLNYDLLAELTKPDGVRTDGVLLNMLRRVKRTARAKPPFYGRHEVRHNVDELRAHYKHVVAVGKDIEYARQQLDHGQDHHTIVPPTINRSHGFSCACAPLGTMFDDGSDIEGFLSEFYEEYDPLERYDDDATQLASR